VATSLVTTDLPPGVMMASDYSDAAGINMVVFSYPGVGKTTFISHAQDHPMGRNVVIMDFDKGIRSIGDRNDVPVWRPPNNTWADVESFVRYFGSGNHDYKTLGIDSLSTLLEFAQKSVTSGQLSQPDHGKANEKVLKVIRDLKEVSTTKGLNFILTAHAEDFKDSDDLAAVRMIGTPQVVKGVYQIFDDVGYLDINRTSGKRKMILKPTGKVLAKYRQPETGPQLPLEIPDPTISFILDHIHGKKA
jgi:AAA domain-containing protein